MTEKSKRAAKENNERVLERMKNKDDTLHVVSMKSSWFPPRQIIVKDKKEIERLYGEKSDAKK